MDSHTVKALQFRQLHRGPAVLILPNAWDVASARIFESAGFPAIATTSAGIAFFPGLSRWATHSTRRDDGSHWPHRSRCPGTCDR